MKVLQGHPETSYPQRFLEVVAPIFEDFNRRGRDLPASFQVLISQDYLESFALALQMVFKFP